MARIERDHTQAGHSGRGVGERQAAAERAAIADRGMGDERGGRRHQWRMMRDQFATQDIRMARAGPNPQYAGLDPNFAQLLDACDVDQQGRRRETEVQRRELDFARRQLFVRPRQARREAGYGVIDGGHARSYANFAGFTGFSHGVLLTGTI